MDHQALAQLLGNYGEFLGAIGVVVTLIYLARQIRQSNLAAETAAIQAFFHSTESITLGPLSNGGLIRKGLANWQSLSSDEQVDLSCIFTDWASKIHMGYRLYLRRALDAQTYDGWEGTLVSILKTPGGDEWWSNAQLLWPTDFRNQIDRVLSDEDTEILPWDEVMPWYSSSNTQ